MEEVVERAVADASTLVDAGFPALMVENFGDAPFYPERVPAQTVASMTRAVTEVIQATHVPLGVNVLRNDALAGVAIAAATGARWIRVNVLTGLMITDQGPIVGSAADLMRTREVLDPGIEVWADVMVKHSVPPAGLDAGQSAIDTVERGLADALIVSGASTGEDPDLDQAAQVRAAVPKGVRLVIGSGATSANLGHLTTVADTVIVGSSIKQHGNAANPVDPDRAKAFVAAARENGLI